MFLQTLHKMADMANRLDKLGYYDIANDIDAVIKCFAFGEWSVETDKVQEEIDDLPKNIKNRMNNLISDLKHGGPSLADERWKRWRSGGKMKDRASTYHARIGGGQPTYVAFWKTKNNSEHIIEIIFAGTHEKARTKGFY